MPEMLGVPINDDRGEQIEAGHAEVLPFGGSVADFALAADAQGVFQGVVCFTLVQTDLRTALHVRIEQPFDDEERPFHPSDFAQGHRQFMLSGVGWGLMPEGAE